MSEKEPVSEILKRKFGPISNWKPAGGTGAAGQGLKTILSEAQKGMESIEKLLEPLAGDARAKIRDAASTIVEVAGNSSTEARSFLAKALEAVAERIKPQS